MKKSSTHALLTALALGLGLLLSTVGVQADTKAVATMIDPKGDVTFCKAGGGSWYAAYPELRNRLLDKIKTGNDSVATLQFDVGGKVGINKNSQIEIVGERAVEGTEQGTFKKIVLTAGGIWAKFSGQSQELQVQTSGGVMGIKGTEFVVETTEGGSTTLSVFEGLVVVEPAAGGAPVEAPAGTKLTFDPKTVPVVKTYENPEDLRKEVMEGWQTFLNVAGPILSAAGVGGAEIGYASQAISVVNDPEQAAKDFAASQVSAHVPMGGLFGGAISSAGSSEDKKPDFPTGLAPDKGSLGSEAPTFRWDPVENAKSYVVLLSQNEDMKDVYWSARVVETAAAYPQNGQPLAQGKYFWRLIAVDGEGKPIGKASQTWFDSAGWSPTAATQ